MTSRWRRFEEHFENESVGEARGGDCLPEFYGTSNPAILSSFLRKRRVEATAFARMIAEDIKKSGTSKEVWSCVMFDGTDRKPLRKHFGRE